MSEKTFMEKMKKGEKDLKTGFFSFKFTPDYLSAINNFTQAANGFRSIEKYDKAIEAFTKVAECNIKLPDHYSAANTYKTISEIYFFKIQDIDKGIESLKEASYNYKAADKYTYAIKSYSELALKFSTDKNYEPAERLLTIAFDECKDHFENELVRICFEDVMDKLLDVECALEKYSECVKFVEDFIDLQIEHNEKNKYKISKNLIKLGMLRILLGENYMIDQIISKMFSIDYDDAKEDAADLRKLNDSLNAVNKKDFTYCISSAFSLFENHLLKALQKLYAKREVEGPIEVEKKTIDKSKPIILDPSKLGLDLDSEKKEDNNNKNGNNNDDDLL